MNYYTYANAHAHAVFYFHAHAHEYTRRIQLCSALSYGAKMRLYGGKLPPWRADGREQLKERGPIAAVLGKKIALIAKIKSQKNF